MTKLTTPRDGRRHKINLGSGAKMPSPPRSSSGTPKKPPIGGAAGSQGHISGGLFGPPLPEREPAAVEESDIQRSIDEGLRCWGGSHDGGGRCCDVLLGRLVRARWPLPIDLFGGERGEPVGSMERGETGLVLGRGERHWLLMDARGCVGWTVVSRVLWEVPLSSPGEVEG